MEQGQSSTCSIWSNKHVMAAMPYDQNPTTHLTFSINNIEKKLTYNSRVFFVANRGMWK